MPEETTQRETSKAVAKRSPQFAEMEQKYWRFTRPLRGGTHAMQAAADVDRKSFLPKRTHEETQQWEERRDGAILDPMYDEAVDQAASRPFVKPVTITEPLPDRLAPLEWDTDLRGNNLSVHMQMAFDAAIDYGMVILFTDFPSARIESRADEALYEARPTITTVTPDRLYGVDFLKLPNGSRWPWRCRIADTETRSKNDPTDVFATETANIVRVYSATRPPPGSEDQPIGLELFARMRSGELTVADYVAQGGIEGTCEIWEQKDENSEEYLFRESRPFTFPGLPIRTCYTNRKGLFKAQPAFWKLAELNLHDWQFGSVHTDYTAFAQTGIFKTIGLSEEQWGKLVVTHRRTLDLPEGADADTLECKGSAYDAGKDYLQLGKLRGKELSLEPFMREKPGNITATGDQIRDAKANSKLQRWQLGLNDTYNGCLDDGFMWFNANRSSGEAMMERPEGLEIQTFSGYHLLSASESDISALQWDVDHGLIAHETYLTEGKARGRYLDDFEPEVEARKAQREGAEKAAEVAEMIKAQRGADADEPDEEAEAA